MASAYLPQEFRLALAWPKPGITGWAQIHGYRGETDTDEKMQNRVDYDLYYIDNWSLVLDLHILLRTVVSPTSHRNAY